MIKNRPPLSYGERIARRLQACGRTQADLAAALKISPSAVSQWAGRDVNVKPVNLVAAADFLRCEIRWLATGEGPEDLQSPATEDEREILATLRALGDADRRTLLRLSRAMLAEDCHAEHQAAA
jgi:transcriptional regulator with XRE-family HTH domain